MDSPGTTINVLQPDLILAIEKIADLEKVWYLTY